MLVLRWVFDASDQRGPPGICVKPWLAVNPSRSQCSVFAEFRDSWWFDAGKFALKEAISQHVLVDLLSVYVSRRSALTAHQLTISFWLQDHTCLKLWLQEGPSLPGCREALVNRLKLERRHLKFMPVESVGTSVCLHKALLSLLPSFSRPL